MGIRRSRRTVGIGTLSTQEVLDRTLLLMRDDLLDAISDAQLVDALTGVRIVFVGDTSNLDTPEGQYALVAAVMLCARSGARCRLEIANVPLRGVSAPLRGERLGEALMDFGSDLIPGLPFEEGVCAREADIAVVIGDSPWRGRARQVLRLGGDAWRGGIGPEEERWHSTGSPFGALIAAGLAAGEPFKVAMRRLGAFARSPVRFAKYFAAVQATQMAMAPDGTPPPASDLGEFDFISGGAVTQAALYALARIPHVIGSARVVEPKTTDPPDLNRYAFLRQSRIGMSKVDDLSSLDLAGLRIRGVVLPYNDENAERISPLAPAVLVGVDDISARRSIQMARPRWLGIGATSHYGAMASFHTTGLACAACLHHADDGGVQYAPTVAWVSFWAGLWLASMFARQASGIPLARSEQQVWAVMLQSDSPDAIRRSAVVSRSDCAVSCPL
jgi:hypothetical protein